MRKLAIVPLLVVAGLLPAAAPVSADTAASFRPATRATTPTHRSRRSWLEVVAQYGKGGRNIVRLYKIGESYEGRNIWALKISDHVATTRPSPRCWSSATCTLASTSRPRCVST